MDQTASEPPDRPANHGRIMLGTLAIAAGVLMLIDRLDLGEIHLTTRLWPLFPLGLGLLRMIDPPPPRGGRHRGHAPGAWLVFIGAWGLVNEFHVWDLDYDRSWPLLVVFAGTMMVWRAVHEPRHESRRERREA